MKSLDRGRRRLRIFALGIAAVFGALALVTWWSDREDLREGSSVLSHGGPALGITEIPTSYRAVVRVENRAGEELTTTTERIWVRRPFQSRIETYAGPPPGQRQTSRRQSVFGVLASESRGADPLNIAVPPSLASGDVRIDAVLEEALEDGTILRRERREVYGRECQVYRAGGPVFAGDLTPYEPRRGDYADLCVDANGIVVEEAWTLNDRLVQRRVVVEIDIDPSMDSTVFAIDVPENEGTFRGAVERLDPGVGEHPGLWTLPDPPSGFERLGRYLVVIPEAALPQMATVIPGAGPSSTTDVFVRGPDLVVVDQDPSLYELVQAESRESRPVQVPGLADARLIVDARMSEVRGTAADGSVVRIFGTLPPSELMELAQRLRVPG